MSFLLSAKFEGDLLAWRGASGFADSFRKALIEEAGTEHSASLPERLGRIQSALKALQDTNRRFDEQCRTLRESLATITTPADLCTIVEQYYAILYNHAGIFRTAHAFYQQSSLFLNALGTAVIRISREQLGLLERHLPEHSLIALGPAGRQEFSPFCPLQLLLLCRHEHGMERESIHHFGTLIHEAFVASGLQIDSIVTPGNSAWCGTIDTWRHLWETELAKSNSSRLIDLIRLADQSVIAGSLPLGDEFRQSAISALASSNIALENLVARVAHLSNGLGILGRLKREKSGPYQGQFPLLDHALLPLTKTISAFALIASLSSQTSPERIYTLIKKGVLSVNLAEQLLEAWHTINELRLMHEQQSQPDWHDPTPLHINLESMAGSKQQALRNALEAIGLFQRYLYSYFADGGRS